MWNTAACGLVSKQTERVDSCQRWDHLQDKVWFQIEVKGNARASLGGGAAVHGVKRLTAKGLTTIRRMRALLTRTAHIFECMHGISGLLCVACTCGVMFAAEMIRNAGGRVTPDVIRSLFVAQVSGSVVLR